MGIFAAVSSGVRHTVMSLMADRFKAEARDKRFHCSWEYSTTPLTNLLCIIEELTLKVDLAIDDKN